MRTALRGTLQIMFSSGQEEVETISPSRRISSELPTRCTEGFALNPLAEILI